MFLLVAVSFGFAAPAKSGGASKLTSGAAVVYGAVESKSPFGGNRLFAVLDSVGGNGNWMEWDINGVKDPSVMEVLNPLLKSNNKPEMVWLEMERVKPLLAVLLQKGAGEVLVFYELKSLDAKPEALAINPVLNPDVVFRDYEQVSESEFVHRDMKNLKVIVKGNTVRFTYVKSGEEPLVLDPGYSKKNAAEKRVLLRDFEDYFKYEFSVTLKAFLQSTRCIFNWQAWHWYMPSWTSKFMMQKDELEAILMSGKTPSSFTLFKAKTAKGETVEIRASGSGFSEMVITRP